MMRRCGSSLPTGWCTIMNRTEIDKGQKQGIKSLHNIANNLEKLDLTDVKIEKFSFNRNDISNSEKISALTKKLPNEGKWIYVFYANNNNAGNLLELLKKFKGRKEGEKGKKEGKLSFAQANSDVVKPRCIYVGSSSGTKTSKFNTRIAQHFGKVPDGTWAIRFNKWLTDDEEITCCYFKVETKKQDVLRALEYGLWDNLQPIIGQRG